MAAQPAQHPHPLPVQRILPPADRHDGHRHSPRPAPTPPATTRVPAPRAATTTPTRHSSKLDWMSLRSTATPSAKPAAIRSTFASLSEQDSPTARARNAAANSSKHVVYRGFLRVSGPLDHEIDPGREDPRRSVPAPDRPATSGWIPGGLALPRHAQRLSARRCGLTRPIKHLPGPAGPVHRTDPASCPQPGGTTHAVSALHAAVAARLQTRTARRPARRSDTA